MLTRCPECNDKPLKPKRVDHSRKVAGHVFTSQLQALVCGTCDEVLFAADVLAAFDLRVAGALLAAGETAGEALRYVRKVAGVAAAELAELLDVRAETVSRWENDKRPIDRGSYAVLHQLVLDRLHDTTATADYLRSLKHPRKLPVRVKLESRVA